MRKSRHRCGKQRPSLVIVAGVLFWVDSLRARERALAAGRSACERYGVQLLDETVQFATLRLARSDEGRLRLRRTYTLRILRYRQQPPPRRHRDAGRRAAGHAARALPAAMSALAAGQACWRTGAGRERCSRCACVSEAPRLAFEAGQFVRIALDLGRGAHRAAVLLRQRAAGPGPRVLRRHRARGAAVAALARLKAGDALFVADNPSGFLVLSEVPPAEDLWLVATGTGIAPFLSILRTATPWQRYRRVILVHGVRHAQRIGLPGDDP